LSDWRMKSSRQSKILLVRAHPRAKLAQQRLARRRPFCCQQQTHGVLTDE
jgi:hypothetical protein